MRPFPFPQRLLACVLLSLTYTPVALASIVVPGDLAPGDQYRLAFVTSHYHVANSPDIHVYNDFVSLNASWSSELNALGTTWNAIASTPTVAARDNTGTNPELGTGVPIYRLDGVRVADDNADLWDGSLDNLLAVDQFGNEHIAPTWTGTTTTGLSYPNHALGEGPARNSAIGGYNGISTEQWIAYSAGSNYHQSYFYGMSDELTVPLTPVPVPAAVFLFASGLIGLLGASRRKA